MSSLSLTSLTPTVLAGWSKVLLDALRHAEAEPGPILEACGFDEESFRDPNTRHGVVEIARLWRHAATVVGDPAFGLRVSACATRTSCHALGYAVFASATLRDALETVVRYHRLVYDGCRLELSVGPTQTTLSMHLQPGYERGADEQVDAAMSLLVRTCRALAGSAFVLDRVSLSRARPRDSSPYTRFFGAPVVFEGNNQLVFASDALALPMREANQEVADYNELAAGRYLSLVAPASLAKRASTVIASRLDKNVHAAAVAKELGLSLRSFQRALTQAGTSYERVLNEVRFELARAHLRNRRLAITEVAYRLGFEHVSTFNRAFRRWAGMTPSDFRRGERLGSMPGKVSA
jgi:AraC-like DNA-binding protein